MNKRLFSGGIFFLGFHGLEATIRTHAISR